jgi:DNA replicative helicase MCM subunit Mcm2 (Cdc46/Mcm family)
LEKTSLFSGKSKSKNQGFYYLYLEAVSIKNSKSQSTPEDLQDPNFNARATELFDLYSFSSRDLEFIVKFLEEHGSDIFRQILQSICPSIYGHELVKGKVICILLIIVYMFLNFHDKSIFCICIIPFSPLLILFNYHCFDGVPLQGDDID